MNQQMRKYNQEQLDEAPPQLFDFTAKRGSPSREVVTTKNPNNLLNVVVVPVKAKGKSPSRAIGSEQFSMKSARFISKLLFKDENPLQEISFQPKSRKDRVALQPISSPHLPCYPNCPNAKVLSTKPSPKFASYSSALPFQNNTNVSNSTSQIVSEDKRFKSTSGGVVQFDQSRVNRKDDYMLYGDSIITTTAVAKNRGLLYSPEQHQQQPQQQRVLQKNRSIAHLDNTIETITEKTKGNSNSMWKNNDSTTILNKLNISMSSTAVGQSFTLNRLSEMKGSPKSSRQMGNISALNSPQNQTSYQFSNLYSKTNQMDTLKSNKKPQVSPISIIHDTKDSNVGFQSPSNIGSSREQNQDKSQPFFLSTRVRSPQIRGTMPNFYRQAQQEGKKDELSEYMNKFIKLNPSMAKEQNKLLRVQQLRKKQLTVIKSIQERNFEETINHMKDILQITATEKHLENFASTIGIIGCLYQYNHDLDNALYSFLQLKNLSELVSNPAMKMKSLALLAQVLQDESQFAMSMTLLRRAIHYAWYLNDVSAESDFYDKLGYLYFMQGDVEKAKYFHGRSIQHETENIRSENRQQSVNSIAKSFEYAEKMNSSTNNVLNQMVLAKMGLITDTESQVKFQSRISAELHMQMIAEDKELQLAQHDPSQISPEFAKLSKVIPEGMENDRAYMVIQRILDSKHQFQPIPQRNTLYKDSTTHKVVDPSVLKLSIEDRVKKATLDVYDDNRLQKKLRAAQVQALVSRTNKGQVHFYNHCSPNRNLLGFKYTFKPSSLKLRAYFASIEDMIKNSENN